MYDEEAAVADHLGDGRFPLDLEAVGAIVTVVRVETLTAVLLGFRFVLTLSGKDVRAVAVFVENVCVHFVHTVHDGFLFERAKPADGETFLAIFPFLLFIVLVEQVYTKELGCAAAKVLLDALFVR